MQIKSFVFNPFQLNTYVLSDDTGQAIIIDPGCSNHEEENQLINYIKTNKLNPVALLNTHCHVDHILGNRFVAEYFSLKLSACLKDAYNIESSAQHAAIYGLPEPKSPAIELALDESKKVIFGHTTLDILFCPGHTAGHICFYNNEEKILICGDVLFNGSIGRTDLPGGDYDQLMLSIKSKLLVLPPETKVYSGHGPSTTIGNEIQYNPFLQD